MLLPKICCFKSNPKARQTAEDIVNQAHKEADNIKKRNYLRQKKKPNPKENKLKQNYEKDVANFKDKKPTSSKEENLERKSDLLDKKKMRF